MKNKLKLCWYLASILLFGFGMILAARYYPGGYDWPYTVVSALASQKNNPKGSFWFASALCLSMALLWPYVSLLKKDLDVTAKFAIGALRTGIVCGVLVGLDRLLIRDISEWIFKSHEILALIAFLGMYFGILGLLVQVMLRQRSYAVAVLVVAIPLLAMFSSQIWLYFNPLGLGWVNPGWREMGIPLWLSFAFWQWLGMGFIAAGLGLLSFISFSESKTRL